MADKYMLWFSYLYDVNYYSRLRLLEAFGTEEGVFKAKSYEINNLRNIPNEVKLKIISLQNSVNPDRLMEYIDKNNINAVSIKEEAYPELLKSIDNPPFLLYYKGRMPNRDSLWINVIGTRRASEYGKNTAYRLASELASEGVTVVSGMARGLDSQAHKGALSARGKTAAVFGTGVDICYPPENKDLYNDIIENGCVISEYPCSSEIRPWHFSARNRIMSGLCRGTVVVEAGVKSGTMITVDCALSQGREVFAVPGNVTSKFSQGTNLLIKEGAHLVRNANDVLDVFGIFNEEGNDAQEEEVSLTDPAEASVYRVLSLEPVSMEEITLATGMEYRKLQFTLTNMELKGRIKKLPGQRYIRYKK